MIGIEYDTAGFPLVNPQTDSLPKIFNQKQANNSEIKMGKLVKYEDGHVEFIAEQSNRKYDVLSKTNISFHRDLVAVDDTAQSFTQLKPVGGQFSTCLQFSD